MPSDKDPNRVETFLRWVQNHKAISVVVIVGICVIALGKFFTSLHEIVAFFRPESAPSATMSPADSPVATSPPIFATAEPVATTQPAATTHPAITSFSPAKMIAEVKAARPLQRYDVGKSFIGLSVDWNLFFIDGSSWSKVYFLSFANSRNGEVIVSATVPKADYPGLHLTEKGTRMRVKGIVNQVTESVVVLDATVISR